MKFIAILVMASMTSIGYAQEKKASSEPSSTEQPHWTQTEIPNLQMAVVSESAGTNTVRLRAFKEVRIPAHWHPTDQRLTVIAGAPRIGEGDQFIASALRELHPGEQMLLAKNTRHFVLLAAHDEIEMRGEGRFTTDWVNPQEVKALKKNDVDSASERSKMKAEQDKR